MVSKSTSAAPVRRASAWQPLQLPIFRALWSAGLIIQIAAWMQNLGAVWQMGTLASSPTLIALVQTASSLPVLLLSIPAGVFADLFDRRRLLIVAQLWALSTAIALGILASTGTISPVLLLLLTAAVGVGAALAGPAFQAVTNDVVPAASLPEAVTLNGAAINLGRAIGPSLAGFVIAASGTTAVFWLNAAMALVVLLLLVQTRWQPVARSETLPAEHILGAIRAGLRFARHTQAVHTVVARALLFLLGGSALWALLPIVVRQELRLGSDAYGALIGALGVGAVGGMVVLPRLRRHFETEYLVAAATLIYAAASALPLFSWFYPVLVAAMVVAGLAWITVVSSLNLAAQAAAPLWVRARTLALYLLVFQGSLALGSLLWGLVAARLGASGTLGVAALVIVAGLGGRLRWPLRTPQPKLNTALALWPEPPAITSLRAEDGPVLVTVAYRVDPAQTAAFVQAMQPLRQLRLRDGAQRWELFADPATPEAYLETFLVDSWGEHMRQHTRAVASDQAIIDHVRSLQQGGEAPVVNHLIAAGTARQPVVEDAR